MAIRVEDQRNWRLLWPLAILLFGAVFMVGIVAAQPSSAVASYRAGTLAPVATPPGCLPGWRIVDSPNPDPGANQLFNIDAASETDMWAVGQGGATGLVEHWDGSVWSIVPTPNFTYTRSALLGVKALSANDAWAVGHFELPPSADYHAAILHWDGASWSSVPTPPALDGLHSGLFGVDGISANDVWAVGYQRTGQYGYRALTLHWDGTEWSIVPNPVNTASSLHGVTAIASDDVWAVGGAGGPLLMHWDGVQWNVTSTSSWVEMYDVSATASNDVWAVGYVSDQYGYTSSVLHWNGTSWSEVSNQHSLQFQSIEAIAPNDVWVVGGTGSALRSMHWNGTQWRVVYLPLNSGALLGAVATSSNEVWAVGREDINGGSSQTLTLRNIISCPAITPTPAGCNTGWNALDSPNGDSLGNTLRGVAAVSPSDVWAVGTYGPGYTPLSIHWDGYAWTIVPMPTLPDGGILRAISAVASDDVWAVGETPYGMTRTITMHWNGSAWSIVPSPNVGGGYNRLSGVAAISANDVWAVGSISNGPLILHWNGSQWSSVPTPVGGTLSAVSAVSATDVWAVGNASNGGLTLHWNGSVWSAVSNPIPAGASLSGVAVVASDNVWAVGSINSAPAVIHWDGVSWALTPIMDTISGSLYSVSGSSASGVWAVGEARNNGIFETLIMRWDGTQWTRVPSPNLDNRYNVLQSVATISLNEAWAVGDQGEFNNGGQFTLIERYVSSCVTSTPTATATPTSTPQVTFTAMPPTAQATSTNTSTRTATNIATTQPTLITTATASLTPQLTSTATSPSATSTSTASSTSCAITFTDVPPDNAFYPYVRCLACRGVISGYIDGTFRPGNDVTRGQLSKIVANAAGLSDPMDGQTFEDIPAGHTFYAYIERMAGRGIIGGYPCGVPGEPCVSPGNRPYFRPGSNATRGQIAKIVSNAAGFSDILTGQTFEDVAPGSAFYLWIERLALRGVMGGYPCGGHSEPCGVGNRPYFRPNANATRGQLSKIVANTFYPGCQTPQR